MKCTSEKVTWGKRDLPKRRNEASSVPLSPETGMEHPHDEQGYDAGISIERMSNYFDDFGSHIRNNGSQSNCESISA